MRDGFLVGDGETAEFLRHISFCLAQGPRWGETYTLDESHLGLVGGSAALGVGTVTVAVSCVGILLADRGGIGGIGVESLADGGVEAGNVFLQEGADGLADEFGRHLLEARLVVVLLPPSVAIVSQRWRRRRGSRQVLGRRFRCRGSVLGVQVVKCGEEGQVIITRRGRLRLAVE